jgi:hypothetical protein
MCGKLPADMWDYQAHSSTQDKPTIRGFSGRFHHQGVAIGRLQAPLTTEQRN